MRRTWLIFSQAVTIVVAVMFVVGTLKPEWLRSGSLLRTQVSVVQAPAGAVSGAGGFSAAVRVALPAVVSIAAQKAPVRNPHANDPAFRFFFGDRDDQTPSAGLGSGVIVSPEGYLLTNHHVIEGATDIDVRLADGREARARLVGTDPETDIAVLRIDLAPLPVVALGDVSRLSVGDAVLAIGNPFNVGQTVTAGIVSALERNRLGLSTFENFIQTDAAINPGNSGGALVDVRGALVGINTAIYSQGGGSLGIGFAVPVDLARQVMDDLVRDGRVIRGWIGVEPRDLPADLAASLGLEKVQGVLITGVLQGGPAAVAGLRPGDVVTAVGPRLVQTTADLLKAVAALKPQSVAPLSVVRNGQRLNVEVRIGQRPTPGATGNPR
ncbi:MAG: trypsin-like peptidase domain-containing protein [Betaproteobacteria bacterium]